jgi:hypothetical protein
MQGLTLPRLQHVSLFSAYCGTVEVCLQALPLCTCLPNTLFGGFLLCMLCWPALTTVSQSKVQPLHPYDILVVLTEFVKKTCMGSCMFLNNFACVGRVGEVAWLQWEYIRWDPHFKCLIVNVPQGKVGKVKPIAIVGGVDRHCDIFLQLGEFLMSMTYSIDRDETPWLFALLCQEYVSTTISKYVKDMTFGTNTKKFAQHLVAQLFAGATASACPASNRISIRLFVVHVQCLQMHDHTVNYWASWIYCLRL